MRPLCECRVALKNQTLRQTLMAQSRPGRRTGAIMITDDHARLVGIFTDSDLARLLEAKRDEAIDLPLEQIMTRSPTTVPTGTLLAAACEILSVRKISELPVIDAEGKPLGIIDITDVVGLAPTDEVSSSKFQVSSQSKSSRKVRNFKLHQPDS